ncbi:MAG: helix-turn-helix transcriptional regulator [Bacillota bacterium]
MNIADRIQNLRKTKGISQEELADKVGVSRQAVSKWESEQSFPDLEKIIMMSEYFNVTTDYILRGIEPIEDCKGKSHTLTSKVLYVASTAFIVIGLLCAFSGWYEEQTAESIWGSMIIQAVGVAGYFIGKLMSQEKAPFTINWLNIILVSFIPISMIVAGILNRVIAPYPTDILSGCAFAVIYIITATLTFIILKRQAK